MDSSLVQYYIEELSRIEDDCAEFAQSYPQVATRLGVGRTGGADPHVRQLIEAVAFIAARLRRQIDGVGGDYALAMLRNLAPWLADPYPSMAVAQFACTEAEARPVATSLLGRRTILRGRTGAESDRQWCSFSVVRDTALWPFRLTVNWASEISDSESKLPGFERDNCLVMRFESGGKAIPAGSPGDLTLFVSGALNRALAAMEAIEVGLREVHCVALDGTWRLALPRSAIFIDGFEPEDRFGAGGLKKTNPSRLATEFFQFPRRFCFLKVAGVELPQASDGFALVLVLDPKWVSAIGAVKDHIVLNAVPIVNLYPQQATAVKLIPDKHEYWIPRMRGAGGQWDIYSINAIRLMGSGGERTIQELLLSGIDHQEQSPVYWSVQRRERVSDHVAHASAVINLVDGGRAPACLEGFDIALLDVSCTDCRAPELLEVGSELEVPDVTGRYRAWLETPASPYVPPLTPAVGQPMIWQILASSSLRGLGSDVSRTGIAANAKSYLRAHNRGRSKHGEIQIAAIREIERSQVAVPDPSGGVMLGVRYDVFLKQRAHIGGGRYVLCKVLKGILGQLRDINTSIELYLHGLEEEAVPVS